MDANAEELLEEEKSSMRRPSLAFREGRHALPYSSRQTLTGRELLSSEEQNKTSTFCAGCQLRLSGALSAVFHDLHCRCFCSVPQLVLLRRP